MSTPDPAASPTPPPPSPPSPPSNSGKKWLLGCLIALLLAVLLILGAAMLIIYVAKRQVDAIAPDAHKLAEDARRAAAALQSAQPVVQDMAKVAEARMRLGRAAMAAAAGASQQASRPQRACPAEAARAALPVDGQWFVELGNRLPETTFGTAWMRDPAIVQAAGNADQSQAWIALDGALAEAGAVAVIQPDAGATIDDTHFQGHVQLVGYPDGETMCTAAFHAEGADASEFQTNFWTAEEAALGK